MFLLQFSNDDLFQHGAGQAAHQPDLLVLKVREEEQTVQDCIIPGKPSLGIELGLLRNLDRYFLYIY